MIWLGSSRADLRRFPENARRRAGFELRRIQMGWPPTDSKPIAIVGPGVMEIRIHTEVEHRVLYLASFPEAVYVLHVFEKRSRTTGRRHVDVARERLWRVLAERKRTKR